MNPPASPQRKSWRRLFVIIVATLLGLYVGSYVHFRMNYAIIHARGIGGGATYHAIVPGSPHSPSILLGAVINDQLDELPSIEAAIERRQNFLAIFYAPLGFAETLAWRVID